MNTSTGIQSLLEGVRAKVESAFSEGVYAGGSPSPWLPPLKGYEIVPSEQKPNALNGILASFAPLLGDLANYTPTPVDLTANALGDFQNGTPSPQIYKTLTGEVVLRGIVQATADTSPNAVAVILSPAYRPTRDLRFAVVSIFGVTGVLITPAGQVQIINSLTSGEWVCLDGIRYEVSV